VKKYVTLEVEGARKEIGPGKHRKMLWTRIRMIWK